jgi:hypothetical protein
MADDTGQFAEKPITTWTEFTSEVFDRKNWIFRGQSEDWDLATSLERRLLSWGIDPTRGPAIERALLREFRRRLRGEEYTRVKDDTLYCLALTGHPRGFSTVPILLSLPRKWPSKREKNGKTMRSGVSIRTG